MEREWKVTLAMAGRVDARSDLAIAELRSELKDEISPDFLLLQTTQTVKLEWERESNRNIKNGNTQVHALGSVSDHLRAAKKEPLALAGVAQWIECQPANQKVTGLIPSLGPMPGLWARSLVGGV